MADQVLCVLKQALPISDRALAPLANVLTMNEGKKATVNGQNILRAMAVEAKYGDRPELFKINLAVLQSLFTQHMQGPMGTCSMNSIIIAEASNNPARLGRIFSDFLTKHDGEQIAFASEQTIQICQVAQTTEDQHRQQPHMLDYYVHVEIKQKATPPSVDDYFVPSNLMHPEFQDVQNAQEIIDALEQRQAAIGIDKFNEDDALVNALNAAYDRERFENENIGYQNTERPYSLQMPIRNLNDVLLANMMAAVYASPLPETLKDAQPSKDIDYQQKGPYYFEYGFIRSHELYFGKPGHEDFAENGLFETADEPVEIDYKIGDNLVAQPKVYGCTEQQIQNLVKFIRDTYKDGERFARCFTLGSSVIKAGDAKAKINGKVKIDTQEVYVELDGVNGHIENIYVGNVSNLNNPANLSENQPVPIGVFGDRNWYYINGRFYLCVVKNKLKDKTEYVYTIEQCQVKAGILTRANDDDCENPVTIEKIIFYAKKN